MHFSVHFIFSWWQRYLLSSSFKREIAVFVVSVSTVDLLDVFLPSVCVDPYLPAFYIHLPGIPQCSFASSHQEVMTLCIYFSVPSLFHLAWCFPCSSMLLQMRGFPQFLKPTSIPGCVCVCVHIPHFSLFIHRLIDIERHSLCNVYNLTVNQGVWVSLQPNDFIFFEYAQ